MIGRDVRSDLFAAFRGAHNPSLPAPLFASRISSGSRPIRHINVLNLVGVAAREAVKFLRDKTESLLP